MDSGFKYSASELQRIHTIFQPIYEAERSGTTTLEESFRLNIALLTTELEKDIDNALVWSLLADNFGRIREDGKLLNAYRKAYELEPNNPRAIFNLASGYNKLAIAGSIKHPMYGPDAQLSRLLFDPANAKNRLQEVGISEEEAAQQSWDLFFQVLNMNITPDERAHVLATTANLKKLYPHLKVPRDYKRGNRNILIWLIALIPVFFYLFHFIAYLLS